MNQATSHKPQATSHKPQATSYKLQSYLILSVFLFLFNLFQAQNNPYQLSHLDSVAIEPDTTIVYPSSYVTPPEFTPQAFGGSSVTIISNSITLLKTVLKKFKIISINTSELNTFVKSNRHFSAFYLKLDTMSHFVEIIENDLRSPNYISETNGVKHIKNLDEPINQYKGYAKSNPENMVRLTITENELSGLIHIQATNTWLYIEPLKDVMRNITGAIDPSINNNLHIVYDVSDIIKTEATCVSEINSTPINVANKIAAHDPCTPLVLEIATVADYEFCSRYGAGTFGRILYLLNVVEGIYSANFNVNFSIVYQYLHNILPQPLNSANPTILMNELVNLGKTHPSFSLNQKDAILLFTGKTITYGSSVIYGYSNPPLGNICKNSSNAFEFTVDRVGAYLTLAHEIGHMFDLRHEDGSCPNPPPGEDNSMHRSIMCQDLKSLWFNDVEKVKISAFINTYGSCLENDNLKNVNGDWVHTWTNAYNKTHIGWWGVKHYDKILSGDFEGDGSEELFCISADDNNAWAMLLKYNCGYGGSDWTKLWSNNANNTISTWRMNPFDKHYTGDFNGDGKTDLLSISPNYNWATIHSYVNGNFQFMWSNMGNKTLSEWNFNYGDKLVIGDFNNDGKDEALCFQNKTNGYIGMIGWENNWQIKPMMWHNYGNGIIGGVTHTTDHHYRAGNFHDTGHDELFVVSDGWAVCLRYNESMNNWDWIWSNNGNGKVSGWNLPLDKACLIEGNIDGDNKDELMFIQRGPYDKWATTMDFNANNNLNWNWSNYGSGQIADWQLNKDGGQTGYWTVKNNSKYSKQLFCLRAVKYTTGWWLWEKTKYKFEADMYRSSLRSNFRTASSTPTNEESRNQTVNINAEKNLFLIYPNPNNGFFIIKAALKNKETNYSVFVYDLLGKPIITKENINTNALDLDLTEFAKGLYYIKVVCGTEQTNTKIIIQ